MALLEHLRWWLAEEVAFADSYGSTAAHLPIVVLVEARQRRGMGRLRGLGRGDGPVDL
jgi:hypothetical protein